MAIYQTDFFSWGISREYGWRNDDLLPTCQDPCVVCLERTCTVAAEGKLLLIANTVQHSIMILRIISLDCIIYEKRRYFNTQLEIYILSWSLSTALLNILRLQKLGCRFVCALIVAS